jgi:hypothetical protein
MKPYFKSEFKRQSTPSGKYFYLFDTLYTQDETNRNEVHPLAVDGCTYENDMNSDSEDYLNPPENISNPEIVRKIYTQWINDCSGAFYKCPTIEQCLAKSESHVLSPISLPTIYPEEEDNTWTLQWLPIKIKVDSPVFQIYWSPAYKIPSKNQIVLEEEPIKSEPVDIQNPEKTYTILPRLSETESKGWIQEMADLHVPYADMSTLRLESELEIQKEKFRRKVREARIRAKLSRYRAERIAVRFEEKFGFYPEEDAEEAQTDVENSSDD